MLQVKLPALTMLLTGSQLNLIVLMKLRADVMQSKRFVGERMSKAECVDMIVAQCETFERW